MSGDSATEEDIMEATFRALSKHGYADLTVQSIADEFDKSKSLIHYHYDSKADLMVAFLSFLSEAFIDEVRAGGTDDPVDQLRRMARIVVVGHGTDEDDLHRALLGLRAQAPYDDDLRAQLVENDALIRELVADIVREGIERGEFRDVDPDRYAALFRSAIEGAQAHDVVLGDAAPTDEAFAGIEAYLLDDLLLATE